MSLVAVPCDSEKPQEKRKEGSMAEEKVGTGLFLLYLYFCLQCRKKQATSHLEVKASDLCMCLRHLSIYGEGNGPSISLLLSLAVSFLLGVRKDKRK